MNLHVCERLIHIYMHIARGPEAHLNGDCNFLWLSQRLVASRTLCRPLVDVDIEMTNVSHSNIVSIPTELKAQACNAHAMTPSLSIRSPASVVLAVVSKL